MAASAMRLEAAVCLLSVGFTVGCGSPDLPAVYSERTVEVPLSQLLTEPGRFHHRRVRVAGVCSIQFENVAIYRDCQDFERLEHAVWLTLGNPTHRAFEELRDLVHRKHCVVEGRADAQAHGHLGSFVATIAEITRIEPSSPEEMCARDPQPPPPPPPPPSRRTRG
jgi:hypothetical protein